MEDREVFKRYRSRSVKTSLVTIQRGGTFSLNWAAFEALGKPQAIELSFSRLKRIIFFRSIDLNDPSGIPVRKQGNSDSYTVAGLTFTKDYDIDISIARRYIGHLQHDMLIVDLNSPSADATGPRARDRIQEGLQEQERRRAQQIAERGAIADHEVLEISPTKGQSEPDNQQLKDLLHSALSKVEEGKVSNMDDLLKQISLLQRHLKL